MIYLGDKGEKPHMRMIRTNEWKLVLYNDDSETPLSGGQRHELFDLIADPDEINNLYRLDQVSAIQRDLEARLADWMHRSDLK